MSYEQLLESLSEDYPELVVMTAENRAAIRGLATKLGDRFIDVGIAEQTLIGTAAGMALRGRVPIAHALATFLTMRAFEFIRTDVGIPRLPVKLVGGFPGFLSEANGPTHQAIEDIALMRMIPNMQIFCPSDEEDLMLGLPAIIGSDDPCYIRYYEGPADIAHEPFRIGRHEVVRRGANVTILTYGHLLKEALRTHALLEKHGVSTGVINMRTLRPIDETLILAVAETTSLLVTIEDHFEIGGLYSILCEIFLRNQITVPIKPISLRQRWFKPALLDRVMETEGFTAEQMAGQILRELRSWNTSPPPRKARKSTSRKNGMTGRPA